MYIYDRSSDNKNVYLSRPRQCLPVAYVIYHRVFGGKATTPSRFVPVYHFHCTGVLQPAASDTIDLTCDEETESSVSSVAVVSSASGSSTSERSSSSSSSLSWRNLETHFLSLVSDVLPTQSQVQQNMATAAATLTPPKVSHTSSVPLSVNSGPLFFMLPFGVSSTSTLSTERPQLSTGLSSQQTLGQPVSGGALRSSLSGTVHHSVAAGQSVRCAVVSDLQSSQFVVSSLMLTRSVNPALLSQCVVQQTPLAVIGSVATNPVLQVPLSSISTVVRIASVAAVNSSSASHLIGCNTAVACTVTNTARYPPYSPQKYQAQYQTITRLLPVTSHGVQVQRGAHLLQRTSPAQNYRVFRLQPPQLQRQPVPSTMPQISTSNVQSQFSKSIGCTGYGVNLTSVGFTRPAALVASVSSPYQLFVASVTLASSTYSATLSQAQSNTVAQHSVSVVRHTANETGVTWTAGTSGGQLLTLSQYASVPTDEFVDVESISPEQIPPIVIAPDGSVDECDLSADCALQDVNVSRRMSPLQLLEDICLDSVDSADVVTPENLIHAPTDEAGSECNVTDEPVIAVSPINIVPSDSPGQIDYSQVSDIPDQFPLLPSRLSSTDTSPASLSPHDTTSEIASSASSVSTIITVMSSHCAHSRIETGGGFLTSSADSTVITITSPASQFNALAFAPQATEGNSSERNSTHTVQHFPQSCVDVNPSFAPVQTNSLLRVSSASDAHSVTAQLPVAAAVNPVLITAPVNPLVITVLPSLCSVSTPVSAQPAPLSTSPSVTLPTLSPRIPRTHDVTAMATQLVSGLRSHAMRQRATSAAKVAVHQSTQPESTRSRKRHIGKDDDDSDSSVVAKSSRYLPPILNRSNWSAKELAKGINASAKKPDKQKLGETVVYHLNDDGSIEIRIEKGSISENSSQRRKRTSQHGGFDAIVELDGAASQTWYSDAFVTDMGKYFDNLKVISNQNDSSASDKSQHIQALDTANVVKQALTDDAEKLLETQNDDIASDNDSMSTLSLVINSVEPSDEEGDQLPALDNEGENSSGLRIADVYSVDAETFTDLNEQVVMARSSVISDIPREAATTDVEIPRQSYTDANDDTQGTEAYMNVSDSDDNNESRCDMLGEDSRIGRDRVHGDDSNVLAECATEPSRSNSHFSEETEERSDSEDEEAFVLCDSGNTSLFEISLDSDGITDTAAPSVPSSASRERTVASRDRTNGSSERTVDHLSNVVASSRAENNSRQSAEQQTLVPLEAQIHPTAQPSNNKNGEAVEAPLSIVPDKNSECTAETADCTTESGTASTESNLTVETHQLSKLDKSRSRVLPQCHSKQDGAFEGGLDKLDDMASGKKAASAVTLPGTKKSASHTGHVSHSRLTAIEPVSPLPEPLVIDVDLSDVEPDDSSVTGSLEMERESDSALAPVAGKSDAPAECCYSDLLDTEQVSASVQPACDMDVSDIEQQRSNPAVPAAVQSLPHPMPFAENLDPPTRCSYYSDLTNTEPVSPVPEVSSLPESMVQTEQQSVSISMSLADKSLSSRCISSNLISVEPVCPISVPFREPDHSTALSCSQVPVDEKLKAKMRHSYNNLLDTEPDLLVPESAVKEGQKSVSLAVHADDESSSFARPSCGGVIGTEPVSPIAEPSQDTETHLCDVASAAAVCLPVSVAEKSSPEARPRYNSLIDMETIPCDIHTDLHDIDTAGSTLAVVTDDKSYHLQVSENEISASAAKNTVTTIEPVSHLPESPPATCQELVSPSEPVIDPLVSLARHCSTPLDTCLVSTLREPTHASLHEPEHNSFSLNSASLPEQQLSAMMHSSSKLCEINSASLSVFDKSLLDLTAIEAMWSSVSESHVKYATLSGPSSRGYATVGHSSGSVSICSDVNQLKKSHQVSSKASVVTKVPKRITLDDYRNRKIARQVPVADYRPVELVQEVGVADSCEAASKVPESSSVCSSAEVLSQSHGPCFSAVTTVTDHAGSADNPRHECTDVSRLDSIPKNCDLQPTAFASQTVGVSDIISSSCQAVNSACHIIASVAQTVEVTKASNDADDIAEAAKVADDSTDEQLSQKQTVETAARTEPSDVLSAAKCADVEEFQVVNLDNIGQLSPLSSDADDMATNNSNADDQNNKYLLDNAEALCSPESDVDICLVDDITEAVEADSAAASMTGTDAEMLDDVLLDFATSSEKEKKAERKQLSKKRKAARKPWKFTLIPVDTDTLSSWEPKTPSGSADVTTLTECSLYRECQDLPVNIPLEQLHAYIHYCGVTGRNTDDVMCRCDFDETSDTMADSILSVVSLKDAAASRCSTTQEGQLLQVCNETSLLTSSNELSCIDDTSDTSDRRCHSTNACTSNNSAETKDGGALKADVSVEMQASSSAVNEQIEGISTSACTQSVQSIDYDITPSSSATDVHSSHSEFDIAVQPVARSPRSPISSLSSISMNSSHLTATTTTSQCGLPTPTSTMSHSSQRLVSILDDTKINTFTDHAAGQNHQSQILHTAVSSENHLESLTDSVCSNNLTAQTSPSSSEVASKTDDLTKFSSEECTSQDTVEKKNGRKDKRTRKGHLKAATMWQNSMRAWMNMDMSRNEDHMVPKFTLSNDYFVMRQHVMRLMKSVGKLPSRKKVHVKDVVSSSLKATENMLQEELVYVDSATSLNNSNVKLLFEKQLHMNDLLSSVESQLHELSRELHHMSDAEAELSSYEKADWLTESGLHYNILLLTRHMLYKEMNSLRCYHNSRQVYRLPNELCLAVEHDRFVSVEGCILFLEYSILSLAECRELFALKVEIEEAQSNLAQLDDDSPQSLESVAVVHRLGWLHMERKQRLNSISVKSVDSLQTLRAFLSQQLHWYRYVNLFSCFFTNILLIICSGFCLT